MKPTVGRLRFEVDAACVGLGLHVDLRAVRHEAVEMDREVDRIWRSRGVEVPANGKRRRARRQAAFVRLEQVIGEEGGRRSAGSPPCRRSPRARSPCGARQRVADALRDHERNVVEVLRLLQLVRLRAVAQERDFEQARRGALGMARGEEYAQVALA